MPCLMHGLMRPLEGGPPARARTGVGRIQDLCPTPGRQAGARSASCEPPPALDDDLTNPAFGAALPRPGPADAARLGTLVLPSARAPLDTCSLTARGLLRGSAFPSAGRARARA